MCRFPSLRRFRTYRSPHRHIADWEFNQNAPAIDAMREGNRSRKAKERARKSGGKSASEKKREKLVAFLAAHPSA